MVLLDPDNGGAVGRFLRWAFGRSWRTTVLGLLSLSSTFLMAVSATQDAPGPVARWAPVLAQGLTAAAVMLTKDAKISGVDRPYDPTKAPHRHREPSGK